MDTNVAIRQQGKLIGQLKRAQAEIEDRECRIRTLQRSLRALVRDLDDRQPKDRDLTTGWYAGFHFNSSTQKWECVVVVDDTGPGPEDDPFDGCEVVMAIANPDTLKEYDGL